MALHAVAQAPPRLLRPCPKALSPNLAIDPPRAARHWGHRDGLQHLRPRTRTSRARTRS